MSGVLQLALKHLDDLSHGTHVGTAPLPHPPREGTNKTPGTVGAVATSIRDSSDRRCCACGQFARFGFGVRLLHSQEGRWFCAAHRPEQGSA
jgi:hypothetical protein